MSGNETVSPRQIHAAKCSQMQHELFGLQTEALNLTRRLRSDLGTLFQHAQAGIQQTEQDIGSGINQKSSRDHFLEQLKLNQITITKDFTELTKYLNSITTKAYGFMSQVGIGQQAPHLLLSGKCGDDNQHSAIKIAGSSSPTVYNKYQQMLNSAIMWENLESNAAAIYESLHSGRGVFKRRQGAKIQYIEPSAIESKLKDHSKNYDENGVSFIIKAFLEHKIIHVRLEKICSIYLFVKDSQIEKINCIGLSEIEDDKNYESDRIHKPSKFKLYQQMALFIQSYYFSALRLVYPPCNDDAIFKCLRMLRYYKDFLTEDCAKCGRITLHGLPPFCIDYGMIETDRSSLGSDVKILKYHVECFPHNL